MKKYLFRDDHNGYYASYHPFEVSCSLTQSKVDELILSIIPAARRAGSSLGHLLESLDKKNIKFKQYSSKYYKEGDSKEPFHRDLDPLPECMYSWDILKNVSGNY